jgi:hypothetical protein
MVRQSFSFDSFAKPLDTNNRLATLAKIQSMVEETFGGVDRDLTSELGKKQVEFDQWHTKIRESAKARQREQCCLAGWKRKASDRVEVNRRIKNLECDSEELITSLNIIHGDSFDSSELVSIGDADKDSGFDATEFDKLFRQNFDPRGGFSEKQATFLATLPSVDRLQALIKHYQEHNKDMSTELELLKTKNVVLGKNYRRMVIACTGWTAEQVDEAVEGLAQCVKELKDNPVPDDEAIEILMRDRGQDW